VVSGSAYCCLSGFRCCGFLVVMSLHLDAGARLFFLLSVVLTAAAVPLPCCSVSVFWLLAGSSAPILIFLFGFRFQLYQDCGLVWCFAYIRHLVIVPILARCVLHRLVLIILAVSKKKNLCNFFLQ
jgi:hypothetical protein